MAQRRAPAKSAELLEAENPETSPERLRQLSAHKSPKVRAAVASNPQIDSQLLLSLLSSYPSEVAQNPALSLLLLTDPMWLRNVSPKIRAKVGAAPNLPDYVWQELVAPGDEVVLQAVLRNEALGDAPWRWLFAQRWYQDRYDDNYAMMPNFRFGTRGLPAYLDMKRSLPRRAHRLTLNRQDLGDEGMRILAEHPIAEQIQEVNVSGNGIGPEGTRWLARMMRHGALRSIRINDNPVGDEGAILLAAASPPNGLRAAHFDRTDLGDEGVRAMAASPLLSDVEDIFLSSNRITAAGVQALAEGRIAPHVQTLVLDNNPIGDAGVEIIAASPRFSSLRGLSLEGCGLGPRAAQAIADSPHMVNLRRLFLRHNRLGPEGRRHLHRFLYAHTTQGRDKREVSFDQHD